MEVSIIIPLFNRLDLTRVCLESLERTLPTRRYEVILVDDGSTDGTRAFLHTLPAPRYRVVLNDASRGYAANNNLGARLARAPLLCLLNNDTVLRPRWLEPMARAARWLPGVAFVGNVQREPVSGLIDHYGVFFDRQGIPLHAGRHTPLAPTEDYLEWPAVTAACCVVRRSVFLGLGGFDEGFRNGFEDVDLCLRAHEHGYRHFVANRSEIFHHVSASPGRQEGEDLNAARFHARWDERLMGRLLSRRTRATERAAGVRSLRKGWHAPQHTSLRQLMRAGQQVVAPTLSRALPALPRALFAAEDALRTGLARRRSTRHHQGNPVDAESPIYLVVGTTVQNPSCDGTATAARKITGALGRQQAPVRCVVWEAAAGSLCLLPPGFSPGQEAEGRRETAATWERQASRPSLFDPLAAETRDSAFTEATFLHALPPADRPPPGSWIVLPEVPPEGSPAALVDHVHRHGWRLAAVLHDLIATNEPQLFPPGVPNAHALYLRALSGADLVLPVSDFTAHDWRLFTTNKGLPQPPSPVCKPGADTFLGARITAAPRRMADAPMRILCVGAVEPRKGHLALLAAFELARAARPDVPLELCFVGKARPGDPVSELALHEALRRHPGQITWFQRAEYSTLRRLYELCDFTVYPSVLEGCGLPILESLWCRRPCVCANFGVMEENAREGGCVTTDVRDPQALADALLTLATSPEHRAVLDLEIDRRTLRTWEDYAQDLLGHLRAAGE